MSCCPRCGRELSWSLPECPECAASLVEKQGEGTQPAVDGQAQTRTVIARFHNGAEAGYFADELSRNSGISTDVMARERFDAVHAVWSVDYVLVVAPEKARDAALALARLVESTSDGPDALGEEAPPAAGSLSGAWVPWFLTLAAGSVACFGIEHREPRQRPRPAALVERDPREPPELWHVLGATRGDWVQTRGDGKGLRRLTVNPETSTATLAEDIDGDGRTDREWTIHRKRGSAPLSNK